MTGLKLWSNWDAQTPPRVVNWTKIFCPKSPDGHPFPPRGWRLGTRTICTWTPGAQLLTPLNPYCICSWSLSHIMGGGIHANYSCGDNCSEDIVVQVSTLLCSNMTNAIVLEAKRKEFLKGPVLGRYNLWLILVVEHPLCSCIIRRTASSSSYILQGFYYKKKQLRRQNFILPKISWVSSLASYITFSLWQFELHLSSKSGPHGLYFCMHASFV